MKNEEAENITTRDGPVCRLAIMRFSRQTLERVWE